MGIFAPPVKKVLAAAALSVTALTAVPAATVPAAATVVEVHGGTQDVRSPLPLLGLRLVILGTTLTRLTITTIVRDERVGCSIAY